MALTIQETFQVPADPHRVWAYLVDPARVVECLPGAALLEVVDDRTFRGSMSVSVGPVTVAYEGTARFVELSPEERRVKVEAEGQEASGPGSARMTMESVISAGPDGGTEVRVRATIDVAGKIVQFGRGMIQTVSRQVFRQFSECARSRLGGSSAEDAEGSTRRPPSGPEGRGPAQGAPLRPLRLLCSTLRRRLRDLFGL